MRKVLAAALGALALAGCVPHDGAHHGAGYAYGYGYGHGYRPGYPGLYTAPVRRTVVHHHVVVPPGYRPAEEHWHWHGRDPWGRRRHVRDAWWHGG